MPQDAFTLKHLCNELNSTFLNGKVNKIVQADANRISLTIYTGKGTKRLLLDVNPSCPRIAISDAELDSPLTAPNFCMLLRKHLLSATLNAIELVGFDRIVKILFTSSGEFFDSQEKTLYVELMGRYSNVILTENGKILGGNRGINMFDDGVRPLIVGRPYVFPPVSNKKEPNDKSLVEIFKGCDEDLADFIVKNIQGVAKSTAEEIINAFFTGLNDNPSAEYVRDNSKKFFEFLNNFLYGDLYNPCVLMEGNVAKDVFVFPYKTAGENYKFFDSLARAEDFYFTKKNTLKVFNESIARLNNLTNTAIKKVRKKLGYITAREKDALTVEENKVKGELLLANIYKLKGGEESITVENYYDDYSQMTIALDPRISPSKNAENYYKKYNKQKRTLEALAPQKEQVLKELNYLLTVSDEIALCENIVDAKAVLQELTETGIIKVNVPQKKKVKEDKITCREYLYKNFVIKVGRNNIENDRVTFTAHPESIWLHSKDYHSSHVIIEYNGRDIDDEIIVFASRICAYYSAGRNGGKSEVVYTKRKRVKKPPKSKAGFCVYDDFSSVTVLPCAHQEYLKN